MPVTARRHTFSSKETRLVNGILFCYNSGYFKSRHIVQNHLGG